MAIPTTITYFTRIVPAPEKVKLNVDFGVGQVAGKVAPGVNLWARHQFAMGISHQPGRWDCASIYPGGKTGDGLFCGGAL